ncbi:MAG: ATP-binding protein [Firmicutes bacterium]|nr:ATP-binding protein [Candidatus Colivicinus equi]
MINQNYDKLLQLNLNKMAEVYLDQGNKKQYTQLPFDERFAILIDEELIDKKNKAIELLRQRATIKYPQANIADIEYYPERKLDKNQTIQFSECRYINEKLNIIVVGATGAGKTYYACALANAAIDKGIRTKYIRLPDLLYELSAFRDTPKNFKRKLRLYSKYDLLIIDDWLISPLTETQQSDIFELLELRSDTNSTILASQFEPSGWIDRLGSNAVADAIMDRVIHSSYIVTIQGDKSMRETKSKIKK